MRTKLAVFSLVATTLLAAQVAHANHYIHATQFQFMAACNPITKPCAVQFFQNASYYFADRVMNHTAGISNPMFPWWCNQNLTACQAVMLDYELLNDAWGWALNMWDVAESLP